MENDSGYSKLILSPVLAASFIGAIGAAAAHYRRRKCYKPPVEVDEVVIPRLNRTEAGRVTDLETFSHYVARQMGFADVNDCPQLCKLAYEYLRKSEGCEAHIFGYFEKEPDAHSLYIKLIEEFDRCIFSYFAFHWDQTAQMISQVLSDESEQNKTKLKNFLMAATRKQRFEKVTKDLKVTRVFSILVDEMRVIRGDREAKCTDVMAPKDLSERSPVLLLMGGGMGAGKSTLLKQIMKESFWLSAASNAVVVEADAFKERDVIYRALSSMGHHDDMLQTAELVHQSSTNAASSLLVTALNEGRDVVLDGTLSWEPFVEQTIAMARNVHKYRYRMGIGYKGNEDGTITENYWEQVEEDENEQHNEDGEIALRRPYRIELVGVVCDACLAVVRGIRRAIMVGRAVRVNSQLTSHKRFASAFPRYCKLVDNARLYSTNTLGGPPRLIAWKDGDSNVLVDPDEIKSLTKVSSLNDKAQSVYKLYDDPNLIFEPGSVWKDLVLSPSRASIQLELRNSVQKIEEY